MQQNQKSARHAFSKVTREFIKIRPRVSRRETDDLSRACTRQYGFRESRSYMAACSLQRGFESLLRFDNASRIGNAKSACSQGCVYAHMYSSHYMFTRICTRHTYIQGDQLNSIVSQIIILR